MKILSIFAAMAVTLMAHAGDGTRWVSGDDFPLLGKGIDPTSSQYRYQRLPDSLKNIVKRDFLYTLGTNSAGLAIRFASDSPFIKARWKSRNNVSMHHMTPTGIRGLDLYSLEGDSTWVSVNSASPSMTGPDNERTIINNMKPEMREYLLYLSLYDGVDSLYIGVDENSTLTMPSGPLTETVRPVVFYGTSLLQGGCANRPGMAHTNILRRRMNRDMINFGFSGNGQLDLEIADVLAAVPDPGMYVLDFVPNVSDEQIDTLMVPFVEKLEAAHPGIPILFVEDPMFSQARLDTRMHDEVTRRNGLMKAKYEKLAARYPNLYYLPNTDIIGHDNEACVDGLHFTDVGFMRYSDLLEPILRNILDNKKR